VEETPGARETSYYARQLEPVFRLRERACGHPSTVGSTNNAPPSAGAVPAVRGAVKRLATVSDHECGCGDALVAEQTGQGASVVDEEALAALAFVVAASFGSDSPEARAEAEPLPCFSGRGTGRERCFAR
jgi:hypothetical protein